MTTTTQTMTDLELGYEMRRTQDPAVLAEVRRRGYVLDAADTVVGAQVQSGERVGTVTEIHADGGVTVDWDTTDVPGCPGNRYTRFLDLTGGVLKNAPAPRPVVEPAIDWDAVLPRISKRVRIAPIHIFAASDPTDVDVDEVPVVDYDKQGEEWARTQAATLVGNGTVGRLLRTETLRYRPFVQNR
jgi:hypothetical protein